MRRALLLLPLVACAHAPLAPTFDPYELVLPDLDGQAVSLASYRGRVVVLNFFATWCFPCLGQIPLLEALQEEHGADGLQVIGVGLDREAELVLRPFKDFYKLPYPLLVGADRFADAGLPFAPIHTLPTTFVIGRSGTVLASWEGVLPRDKLERVVALALARPLR
ncbi:MAG TPA: TlpA disulfide reductase family protein [Myxococcales bacterium]|nr:TlpA disulfide reductase family protein [Myxococcales bacterium]